jgi:hypothetical protein
MKAQHLTINTETREEYPTEKAFEEYLTEAYGTVNVCGMEYDAGHALRLLDPIAFRCAHSDANDEREVYICPECEAEHEERADAVTCCHAGEYSCGTCGEEYNTEAEADECCQTKDEPAQV